MNRTEYKLKAIELRDQAVLTSKQRNVCNTMAHCPLGYDDPACCCTYNFDRHVKDKVASQQMPYQVNYLQQSKDQYILFLSQLLYQKDSYLAALGHQLQYAHARIAEMESLLNKSDYVISDLKKCIQRDQKTINNLSRQLRQIKLSTYKPEEFVRPAGEDRLFWYNGQFHYQPHRLTDYPLNGWYNEWFHSGQIRRHESYKNGKMIGEYKTWNEYGVLISHFHIKEQDLKESPDRAIYKPVCDYNKNSFIYQHVTNSPSYQSFTGTHIYYRDDGSPFITSNYLNGKLHGKRVMFSASGSPQAEDNWINGLLHGSYKVWTPDFLLTHYQFADGLLNGQCKDFNEKTGKINELVTYSKGIRNGEYKRYDDKGQLVERFFYKDNKRI